METNETENKKEENGKAKLILGILLLIIVAIWSWRLIIFILLFISIWYIWKKINWSNAKKSLATIGATIVVLIVVASSIPDSNKKAVQKDDSQETQIQATSQPQEQINATENSQPQSIENAVGYEIIESENQSHKALGNKSLSEYTLAEISALPEDKKMHYSVVISPEIKNAQLEPTINKIISELTLKDKDIDEISLGISSDKELANGPYDVATATWAPLGKLGNVTAEIAKNNDRSNYKLSIEPLQDNLEEYLAQRVKSEKIFGLTEEQRRQCYKDLVSAESRASKEVNGYNPDKLYDLSEKYKEQVRKKYGITENEELEISVEASMENWPME